MVNDRIICFLFENFQDYCENQDHEFYLCIEGLKALLFYMHIALYSIEWFLRRRDVKCVII